MNISIILVVAIVSQMNTCVKIYQILYCKYVQCFNVSYTSVKLLKVLMVVISQ